MRKGSLWSDVVFKKEVIFHEFDFETSSLEFEVSKSSIWKHTTSCDKGVFSFFHSYLATPSTDRAQIFTGLFLHTPSEKTGLWQLPIVSNVFNTFRNSELLKCFSCLMYFKQFASKDTTAKLLRKRQRKSYKLAFKFLYLIRSTHVKMPHVVRHCDDMRIQRKLFFGVPVVMVRWPRWKGTTNNEWTNYYWWVLA